MQDWVTTSEAANIREISLTPHRIAELARSNKIVARRVGEKKWLVKVILKDGHYELEPTAKEIGDRVEAYSQNKSEMETAIKNKQLQQKEHIKKLQRIARKAVDALPKCFPDFDNEPEIFNEFNETLTKIFRRLTGDFEWGSMCEHLGEELHSHHRPDAPPYSAPDHISLC